MILIFGIDNAIFYVYIHTYFLFVLLSPGLDTFGVLLSRLGCLFLPGNLVRLEK